MTPVRINLSPRRLEAAALLLLAAALLIRYPLHLLGREPFLMDFEVYWAGAQRVLHGQGMHLYAPTSSEMMVFKYAPLWAFLWAPLAWLPKHAAAIVWLTLELVALLLTFVWSARLCRANGLRVHPLTAVVTVLLLLRPLAEEMGNGQSNLLWGFLMVAFLYAAVRHHPWVAAAALAGAILLKLPALLFLPYLMFRRDWALFGRVLGVLSAATAAGSVTVAPHDPVGLLRSWMHTLSGNASAYAFLIGNESLLAFCSRFLTSDGYGVNLLQLSRDTLPWFVAAAGLVGFSLVLRPLSRRPPSRGTLYDAALLVLLMTMLSPSCWTATFVVLAFPVFLAMATLSDAWAARRLEGWSSLGLTLAAIASLSTHSGPWRWLGITSWRGEVYLFLVFMSLTWMTLALFACLWHERRRLAAHPSAAGGR